MSNATRILVVEDLSTDYELARREIRKIIKNCRFERVETQDQFLKALDEFQPDLILSAYSLPNFDGMRALKLAQKHSSLVPVVIWTGVMGESIAVECLKNGASNYILKTDMQRLGPAIIHALEERNLIVESKRVETRYQLIFENSMEGIFQSTPDGRYLSVNPAMARIYGYSSPAEMIETVTDIPSQVYADPGARSQFVEKLLTNEIIKGFEMKNLRKDRSILWTSTSARAVRDEKGNVLYYEGFLQDITERKQAEEKLRESEEKYRFLFENNPLPMWIYDLETLAFLQVNEAAVQHYGYSVAEFMTLTIKDIRPPEDVPALMEKILNPRQGIEKSGQWRHCKRDGTLIRVDITSHSVEFAGRKCELVVAIDVTERVRSEKAGREQRALAEALRLTSEALNSTLDYGEVLDQILTTVGSVVPSDAATIMLIDKGLAHVVRSRGYKERGLDAKIMEFELSLDETANLHRMLETGRPVIIPDTSSFPNWQRVSAVDWIYSNVGAPISLHGEVIGFILLDSETPGFFTPLHAERLEAFANQAALAIHNSRLMQQAQEEIKARKQAEAQAKDLLEFNEKIITHSPLGILTYKMTGECVSVNKNAASILGGSVDKLLAQNFDDIEPWKTSGMYELVQRAVSTRSAVTADVHHITTFGRDIWLRAHFSIFKSKTEDHILLTISDITEQRLAEDRLRESENRLILALSAAQMCVWEWNVENNEVLLSPEFHPITGIPESAFDGTFEGYIGFVHPEDVVRVRESARQSIANNTMYAEEFRIVLPNDEVRWLSNLGHIEYGHSSASMRMIGTVQEITRRKRVEMEQQALLEIMQGLAQAVDLHDLLALVHRSIGNVIFAENFFVVFHNTDTGLFEEIYSVDQYDPPAPPSKLEKSVTSHVFRTGEPLLVDQALFDELVAQGEVELVGTDSASWLGVPLKTLNETIGVIAVQDYQNPCRYSERDKSFLSSIATQVALALERKQAEQKVRESEERYRALFENSPISIWEEDFSRVKKYLDGLTQKGITDFDDYFAFHPEEVTKCSNLIGVLNVNQAGLQMYGANSKKELIDSTHLTLCAGEQEHNTEDFIAIAQGKTTNSWEGADETLAGEPLEISLTWSVVPGYEHDFSKVIVTVIDITQRKRAERELQTSEERFRQMADNIEEVFWMTDARTGRELYLSAAIEKVWGRSSASLMQEPDAFLNSILPLDQALVLDNLEKQRSGKKTEMEYRIARPDGSVHWIWDRAFPIFDEDGEVKTLAGIAADITFRKTAEDVLRESEERFSNAFEYAPIGKALVSLDGRCFKANRALCDLLGYTEHELASMIFPEFTHPEDVDTDLDYINQVLSGETSSYQMEKRYLHKSGTIVWALLSGSLVRDRNGNSLYFIAQVQDITERKNSEKEITRHLTELEALYENGLAVGQLLEPCQIGERVIETFASHLSWHHVTIRLLTPGTDELVLIAFNQPGLESENKEEIERHFTTMINRVGQGLSGWVVQTGRAIRADNVLDYPQYVITHPGIKSGLYMPLRVGERVIGVISVESEEPHALTAQDERLLATLANQAAIAFENARLYQSAQQEIMERRVIEEQLRESQERYRLLIETSPDGIIMMNMDWTIRFGNRQMAGLFNFETPNDLLGMNFVSLFAPEEQAPIEKYMSNHALDELSEHGHWLIKRDGAQFYGELRSSTLQNEKGEQYAFIAQFRDVTERRQSQRALQEERQRFLDLFENSPIPTWLEDFTDVLAWMEELRARGVKNLRKFLEENLDEYKVGVGLIRVLNVNQAAAVMNGAQNKQELLNILHELMVDKTPSPVMVHEFDMIWQGHTSFDFEMSSPRLDGSLVTGILHIYVPSKMGKPDYSRVIVTSTDITERVEIEKKLRTSELHYRELSDSLTDVLVEIDRDLRFIHWNRATEKMLGIPACDAIGRSLHELFGSSEKLLRIEKIFRSVFEENQPKTFETDFNVQGQKLFLEINANPSTRGVSVVARDITERKILETLMQKRFELMDYSEHHSFDDVLQKTIDIVSELTGSHLGFIHFIGEDQTTIKLLTWSTETIQGFGTAEGAGLHYPVEYAGVWADAVRNRVPTIHNDHETLPYPGQTPVAHTKVIREMVIPILRNERIVAVMGVGNKADDYSPQDIAIAERFADYAWDITERKQMESALAEERNQLAKRVEERTADLSRANSNLARALRVKDEFLANMSHELRTPLNAILGLSESLGEQVAGPLNEKQQKYLSTINESGHHLLSLINDILDLAKIEAGQITLDINRVDVNSVCQASLRMIKQLAQKKNLEVMFEIDHDLGLMWADERRLKQMIVNLLSNAVKFTPEYSRIGLQVRGDQAANKVIITVWDTGIGIREEDLERLFKPFVQLDSGLAREAQGTGLGLALVAQMARLHGGSVHVVSRPGEGSRFIVQLPWEPAMASDMAARLRNTGKFRAIDPRAKRPIILLIEDTREVVMMLVDYLEMVGYKMVTAQDGIDGLAQARLSHPDLILMDIQMPRLDGFETTQKLRSDPEFKETPIIALTALAMPKDRQRCLDAGMDEYISKPVNLRALTKTIQRFLTPET